MAIERINIDPGTRRVGYAHRWAKPTLILAIAVCLLLGGCEQDGPRVQPMPRENHISEVGRAGTLPLTLSVPKGCRVGASVPLDVRITNVTDHPVEEGRYEVGQTTDFFYIWLLRDGKDVPLSEYGNDVLQRVGLPKYGWDMNLPPLCTIDPGHSEVMRADLEKLFQLSAPGSYTVIVEKSPFFSFGTGLYPEYEPAKTSFTLLPQQLTTDH